MLAFAGNCERQTPIRGGACGRPIGAANSLGQRWSAAGLNTFVAVPNDSPGGLATLSYEPGRLAIGDELKVRIIDVESA